MNLKKLQLENFASYEQIEIDFANGKIWLLSGNNGAGKSALIKDALTWCLWGRARNEDKGGDSLVRTGQKKMWVYVAFEMNDSLYEVRRGKTKGKTVKLTFVKDRKKSLTGDTIKNTQEKIDGILGMDYEVFVKTSCFEQGKSDSFSNLTGQEAKSVLMNIPKQILSI